MNSRALALVGFVTLIVAASHNPSIFDIDARYEWNQCRQRQAVVMTSPSYSLSQRCQELMETSRRGMLIGGVGILIMIGAGVLRRRERKHGR